MRLSSLRAHRSFLIEKGRRCVSLAYGAQPNRLPTQTLRRCQLTLASEKLLK